MVLSIEGGPPIANVSAGGHGNKRRVGTDIKASWYSMIGLVDGGSGLHEFAHNATGHATGGFWNDLDMLEIGNGEFSANVDAARAHLSAWIICKAPLLMGADLRTLRPEILQVLLNKEAIAILKDPLGVQGRRVVSLPPAPLAGTGSAPPDNQVLLAECAEETDDPLQRWRFNASLPGAPNGLYVERCDSTNPLQRWDLSAGQLKNEGSGHCVVASGDPVRLEACNSTVSAQMWQFSNGSATQTQSRNSTSGFLQNGPKGSSTGQCLNLPWGRGPDVQLYHQQVTAGRVAPNDFFRYNPDTRQVAAQSTQAAPNFCLVASAGIGSGGVVWTVDSAGTSWCMVCGVHSEGGDCDSRDGSITAVPCDNLSEVKKGKTWTVSSEDGSAVVALANAGSKQAMLGFSDGQYNSGPLPFTRYAAAGGGDLKWSWPTRNGSGSQIRPASVQGKIWWNNNTGESTQTQDATKTCLTLTHGGNHELWVSPLVGGRVAVAMLNRDGNRQNATLTVRWEDIGLPPAQSVSVRSIWAGTTVAAVTAEYSELVPGHSCALLVITPYGTMPMNYTNSSRLAVG